MTQKTKWKSFYTFDKEKTHIITIIDKYLTQKQTKWNSFYNCDKGKSSMCDITLMSLLTLSIYSPSSIADHEPIAPVDAVRHQTGKSILAAPQPESFTGRLTELVGAQVFVCRRKASYPQVSGVQQSLQRTLQQGGTYHSQSHA